MVIEPQLQGICLSLCQHHDQISLPSSVILSTSSSTLQDKLVLCISWPLTSLGQSLKMHQFISDDAMTQHIRKEDSFQNICPQGGNIRTG